MNEDFVTLGHSTNVAHFDLFIILLATVVGLELTARRLNLPPAAALILGGIGFALIPGLPDLALDPDLVLVLFLPPLLLSSAYFTPWREFRRNIWIILELAIGAVVFTTLVVGVVAHWVAPSLPWGACFALGAIVSPPDAVAAKAVLQRLSLPPRMMVLLEGESLVNDASGLVLFRFAVGATLTGTFSAGQALASFSLLSVGGIAVGLICALAADFMLRYLTDARMAIIGSFLTAWVSYIGAESAGFSGVLSTVACGLILGWRQHEVLSASIRNDSLAVWSFVIFILESMIFILIGLSMRGLAERFGASWKALLNLLPAAAAIVATVIVARFVWLFASAYIPRALIPPLRRVSPYPPVTVILIMSWAGMRGVVSLAAALSLPASFAGRDFIMAMTFVVILVTVMLQGATLGPLVRRLGVDRLQLGGANVLSTSQARARMATAQLEAVRKISAKEDGSEKHPRLVEQYGYRAKASLHFSTAEEELRPHRNEHFSTVLAAIAAGRGEIIKMHRAQEIDDAVLRALERQLDLEEINAAEFLEGQ
jgi:CPA1 family monovalent cation:H+ antiporter